jgi:protein-tyrosine phosphatase
MIDLHCHILPGVDDGPRGLADSVGMARQAYADGIGVVCATPHIRPDHRVDIAEIAPRVASVQRELDRLEIPVQIVPGGELAASTAEAITAEQLHRITLGGAGGWVLLEPAPGPLSTGLTVVAEGLTARGVGVVVAHPERHPGPEFRERLYDLVAGGCLLQWTAEFVADAHSRDFVLGLARAGLVHVLGSDAHSSMAGRPVRLAAAYQHLRAACTPSHVHWMLETAPRAIIEGRPLTPPVASA